MTPAAVIVATVATVALIQGAYDLLHGPDPARYGLGFNLLSDFLLIRGYSTGVQLALKGLLVVLFVFYSSASRPAR